MNTKIEPHKVFVDIVKQVELTKISESDNPLILNHIKVGKTVIGTPVFGKPTVGRCYMLDNYRTSTVQEIIDDNTFRTHNSIYKWREI